MACPPRPVFKHERVTRRSSHTFGPTVSVISTAAAGVATDVPAAGVSIASQCGIAL